MQCQHCGKSDWVTIGNQKYCANCGESATPEPASPASAPQAGAPVPVIATSVASVNTAQPDATPVSTPIPTPTVTPTPTPAPSPNPVGASMNDVKPAASAIPTPEVQRDIKPAISFHGTPASTSGGVLDLRQVAVTPAPKPEVATDIKLTPAAPESTATPKAEPINLEVPTTPPATTVPAEPVKAAPVATTSEISVTTTVPAASTPATTPQTPASNPIPAAPANVASTAPIAPRPMDAVGAVNASQPSVAPNGTSIQKFVRPDTIAPAVVHAPVSDSQPAGELPNYVTTQIESLKKLVPSQTPSPTPAPANFKQTLSSPPKVQSVMAATVAIVLMGGYIWLNNFNNLSVKSASKKAGIEASFPGYVPNSYSLNGPVAYGPGFVTLGFKSPNSASPLTITQQKTTWDTAALLQLFVAPKSKSYVSVANQGLTIYLYDNNQATWINKGLQYVISGDTRLSREQVLKIATSM